jgi:hypothetical protein
MILLTRLGRNQRGLCFFAGFLRKLARQMTQRRIGFVQHDNAFVELDQPARAQQLADRVVRLPWVKRLTAWARQINPLLLRGGWLADLLQGLRNGDVRVALWGDTRDAAERRRQAHRVTRLLKRLHVRGLLARIPRTRRWRITAHGQSLLTKLVRLHYHGLPQAA